MVDGTLPSPCQAVDNGVVALTSPFFQDDAATVESQDIVEKDAATVGVVRGSAEDQPGGPRRRLSALFTKALATLPRRVVVPAAKLVAVARSAFVRLVCECHLLRVAVPWRYRTGSSCERVSF